MCALVCEERGAGQTGLMCLVGKRLALSAVMVVAESRGVVFVVAVMCVE